MRWPPDRSVEPLFATWPQLSERVDGPLGRRTLPPYSAIVSSIETCVKTVRHSMCPRTWRQTAAAADPRIVLVEDDATIAGMYRYQLEQEGHTVWIAADGEAG